MSYLNHTSHNYMLYIHLKWSTFCWCRPCLFHLYFIFFCKRCLVKLPATSLSYPGVLVLGLNCVGLLGPYYNCLQFYFFLLLLTHLLQDSNLPGREGGQLRSTLKMSRGRRSSTETEKGNEVQNNGITTNQKRNKHNKCWLWDGGLWYFLVGSSINQTPLDMWTWGFL